MAVAKYRAKEDRPNGKPKEVYVLSTAHAPAMGHTNKRDHHYANLYNILQSQYGLS